MKLGKIIIVLVVLGIIIILFWWQGMKDPPTSSLDQEEANFHKRIEDFFAAFESYYGYYGSTADQSELLFITIDEALREGEWTGQLQVISKQQSVEEKSYSINGITDGIMIEFYVDIDGDLVNFIGSFHEEASEFEIINWQEQGKVAFQAVDEMEYQQIYQQFIK